VTAPVTTRPHPDHDLPPSLHPPPIDRPAVALLHRDPPLTPTKFFFHRHIVFVVTLTLVLGLALLAAIDGGSALLPIDEPVAEWVARVRTPAWTDALAMGSHLGDNVIVFSVGAVLAVLTARRCLYLAAALIAAAAFRPLIEFVLKALVSRTRPDIDPLGHFQGPSHPSGHPLAAASLFGLMPAVVALHVRSRFLWWATVAVSVTVVVVVAAARVYKGAHYLTDVVASLAWAGLYLACVQGTFDRFHHDRECRHSQHETQVGV
jgi:membrane-associated phospholipid phosphatase